MKKNKPLCVEVFRGSVVENRHFIDVCVSDAEGKVVFAYGNYEETIFPRSAIKPFQAIPLVSILNKKHVSQYLKGEEIAIITGSHNGEKKHIETVRKLLEKYQISENLLCCGAHWSLNPSVAEKQMLDIKIPTNMMSNCSGKHAGMLILSKFLGAPLGNYLEQTHVVQQRILGICELFLGKSIPNANISTDGCGAPTFAGPLGNWARAYALLADTKYLPDEIAKASLALISSVAKNPFYVAGSSRLCSVLNSHFKGDIFGKSGAEGCYGCSFKNLGLGLTLKCRDGSKLGAEVALGYILKKLGYVVSNKLNSFFYPQVKTFAGEKVGLIKIKED